MSGINKIGFVLCILLLFSFRSIAQSDNNQIGIELYKLVSGNYDLYDIVYCNVIRGGNAAIDNDDLPKLNQFNENVAVYRNALDFGIETRGLVNCTDTVQLRIYRMNVASYRFNIDMKLYPAAPGLTPVLQDIFLNTERVLKFGDTSLINFSVTSNAASSGLRFRIVFRRQQVQTAPFTQIPAICRGEAINLPSISANGVKGTWTPAVNNTATTIYTFRPSEGQCATTQTMTVQVNQPVTPQFTQLGPFDPGTNFTLPATSINNISGGWSPAINNTQTTTYTFTPSAGQCATSVQMTVSINNFPTSVFDLNADSEYRLYPNPLANNSQALQIQFRNRMVGRYQVRMFSISGVLIHRLVLSHNGGTATHSLRIDRELPAGNYIAELLSEKGETIKLRLIIQ